MSNKILLGRLALNFISKKGEHVSNVIRNLYWLPKRLTSKTQRLMGDTQVDISEVDSLEN